jgi:hypothetical protein
MMKDCKDCFCNSVGGQLINNMTKPLGTFTGGLIPSCCPNPNDANKEDLAKSSTDAEGAAAQIKKDEAEAKARRAAVKYLGTVDCSRWPEAEAALISALREDKNECVRWEAAIQLGNGCCCTKKIIQALIHTVNGDSKDGKTAEKSERVKAAAFEALQKCLICFSEEATPTPQDRPEKPERPERPAAARQPNPVQHATREDSDDEQLIRQAKRTLTANEHRRRGLMVTGQRDLAHVAAQFSADEPPPPRMKKEAARPPAKAPPPREPVDRSEAPESDTNSLPRSGDRGLFNLVRTAIEPQRTPARRER